MHIDQILRETAPARDFVDDHVHALRGGVISQFTDEGTSAIPRRRHRHVSRAAIGTATAALIGVGGVAYATGLVPSYISDEFAWTSPHSTISDVHRVSTFTMRVGSTDRQFEIWRGTDSDGRSCTSVYQAVGDSGPNFSGNCGDYPTDAWFDTAGVGYRGSIDDTPPPSSYFIYGEPKISGVTSVRVVGVSGSHFDHTVRVDKETGGYALGIPELTTSRPRGPFAKVEFLAQDGTVLGSRELAEK